MEDRYKKSVSLPERSLEPIENNDMMKNQSPFKADISLKTNKLSIQTLMSMKIKVVTRQ